VSAKDARNLAQVEGYRPGSLQHPAIAVDDYCIELMALIGWRQGIAQELRWYHELGRGEALADWPAVDADRNRVPAPSWSGGSGATRTSKTAVLAATLPSPSGKLILKRW